jgi:hypothetical protein
LTAPHNRHAESGAAGLTRLWSVADSPARDSPLEVEMARRKTKRRKSDRSLVSAKQRYEVYYLARKHRMKPAAVRALIKKVGHSRKKLEAAIAKVKKKRRKGSKRRKRR